MTCFVLLGYNSEENMEYRWTETRMVGDLEEGGVRGVTLVEIDGVIAYPIP